MGGVPALSCSREGRDDPGLRGRSRSSPGPSLFGDLARPSGVAEGVTRLPVGVMAEMAPSVFSGGPGSFSVHLLPTPKLAFRSNCLPSLHKAHCQNRPPSKIIVQIIVTSRDSRGLTLSESLAVVRCQVPSMNPLIRRQPVEVGSLRPSGGEELAWGGGGSGLGQALKPEPLSRSPSCLPEDQSGPGREPEGRRDSLCASPLPACRAEGSPPPRPGVGDGKSSRPPAVQGAVDRGRRCRAAGGLRPGRGSCWKPQNL